MTAAGRPAIGRACPAAMRRKGPGCCCSSVVERTLGKGEVESSILSSSTIISLNCYSWTSSRGLQDCRLLKRHFRGKRKRLSLPGTCFPFARLALGAGAPRRGSSGRQIVTAVPMGIGASKSRITAAEALLAQIIAPRLIGSAGGELEDGDLGRAFGSDHVEAHFLRSCLPVVSSPSGSKCELWGRVSGISAFRIPI